jgi:hypothetical protein
MQQPRGPDRWQNQEVIMIKYKAEHYYWGHKINQEEVERETKTSVWVRGARHAKVSQSGSYHDTWQDAHDHIVAGEERAVKGAQAELNRVQAVLRKAKGMRPPEDEGAES